MAKKTKNYVRDKQPKTLWSKIGPFVKLREYLASNITPDVYANERGLKTKIMEFFGQDVRRDGDIKSLRIDGSKLMKELGILPNSKIENIFKI